MKRFVALASLAAMVAILAGCGGGNSQNLSFATAKGCMGKEPNKASGRTIVKVSGNDCVIADHGAIVIARGHATVAAHGDSTVDAGGQVTLVIFNESVRCNLRGSDVTVINAIKTGLSAIGLLSSSCDPALQAP